MVNGELIIFRTQDPKETTKLNYKLFGRIVRHRNSAGSEYTYYYSGILEDIPFVRLANGCIFVADTISANLKSIEKFACDMDIDIPMITAKEYWEKKVKK